MIHVRAGNGRAFGGSSVAKINIGPNSAVAKMNSWPSRIVSENSSAYVSSFLESSITRTNADSQNVAVENAMMIMNSRVALI